MWHLVKGYRRFKVDLKKSHTGSCGVQQVRNLLRIKWVGKINARTFSSWVISISYCMVCTIAIDISSAYMDSHSV